MRDILIFNKKVTYAPVCQLFLLYRSLTVSWNTALWFNKTVHRWFRKLSRFVICMSKDSSWHG